MKKSGNVSPGTPTTLRSDKTFYRLIRIIAEGGSALVWEADRGDSLRVAVKVLRDDADVDSRRLEQEVDILKNRLRSRHIIRVLDSNLRRSPRFIVFNLVPGIELFEWVGRHRYSPTYVVDFLDILAQITEALSELQGASLVHRDIKPENILIWTGDDQRPRATLLDCGIVRDMKREERITKELTFPASPCYIAPEQISPLHGDLSYPVDIYQFALVLWFGFSGGETRFRDRKPGEVITRYLLEILKEAEERPSFPSFLTLPAPQRTALQELFWEMTDVTPQNRPSIAAVKQRLTSIRSALKDWQPSRTVSGVQLTTAPASWRGASDGQPAERVSTLPSATLVSPPSLRAQTVPAASSLGALVPPPVPPRPPTVLSSALPPEPERQLWKRVGIGVFLCIATLLICSTLVAVVGWLLGL